MNQTKYTKPAQKSTTQQESRDDYNRTTRHQKRFDDDRGVSDAYRRWSGGKRSKCRGRREDGKEHTWQMHNQQEVLFSREFGVLSSTEWDIERWDGTLRKDRKTKCVPLSSHSFLLLVFLHNRIHWWRLRNVSRSLSCKGWERCKGKKQNEYKEYNFLHLLFECV